MENQTENKIAIPNGTFGLHPSNPSSYQLPVFEVVEGVGLKQIEGKQVDIQFTRGAKVKSAMAILELTDLGQGPIWKYEDPDGKVEHFPLIHSGLKKINATWLENSDFQLEIYDGEKNAGIKIPRTGVLTMDDQVIGPDNNLLVDAYVAAIDVKQETAPQEGTTIECLLNMLVHDLKVKQQELPSRENSIAITKLEEAQLWLAKRTMTRKQRGVFDTNNK